MPHIVIEYSAAGGIEDRIEKLFKALINTYTNCEAITPANVKMRAKSYDGFRVAGNQDPFVHITLTMMQGVSAELLADAADQLHKTACDVFSDIKHVTFEIRETSAKTYRKRTSDWSG